jgi:hypothetical protein
MSAAWELLREVGQACWLVIWIWAAFRYLRGWRLEWRRPTEQGPKP